MVSLIILPTLPIRQTCTASEVLDCRTVGTFTAIYNNVTIHVGTMIISGNETCLIENCTFVQTGNISVVDNGTLILRNVDFQMNQTVTWQFGFSFAGHAKIHIENTTMESQYPFQSNCLDKSAILALNSRIYPLHCFDNSTISLSSTKTATGAFLCTGESYMYSENSTINGQLWCSQNSSVYLVNSSLGIVELEFHHSAATLSHLRAGLHKLWNLHINQSVENVSINLTLINTWLSGWSIYCWEDSQVSIYDSEVHVHCHVNPAVSIFNSTILNLHVLYNSTVLMQNCVINGSYIQVFDRFIGTIQINSTDWTERFAACFDSDFYISGNITLREPVLFQSWQNTRITRNFNIEAKSSSCTGSQMDNVQLTLYDENTTVLWTGFTDDVGRIDFNVTYIDGNHTDTLWLEAIKGGWTSINEIQLFSDTPFNVGFRQWDVTGDGYVGIDDIVRVAEYFDTYPGHPSWDQLYDVNCDQYIGIDDIVEVAEHFGELIQ
ncbi:MAG: hypothetical protein JSV05_06190 [Candidatus Bathyarchaeota archaeon]|nr:MAG: hypothetical protein JSV05_06190 [Candidatus Bathyarchaeota archaeon]